MTSKRLFFSMTMSLALFFGTLPCHGETKEPGIVILGSSEGAIDFYKKADFWGETNREKDLLVPRAIVVAINESWKKDADRLPVDLKKEFFTGPSSP